MMSVPPPTLTPDRLYTSSRLTKGTISIDEIETLLRFWRTGESISDFKGRFRQSGILARHTAQRLADIVDLFRVWLLSPNDRGARWLKAFIESGGDRRSLAELFFVYKARSETVLFDYTVQNFWPACHDGALYLRTLDVEDFLREAQDRGQTGQSWTVQTQQRLARGIMRALFDAGLVLRGHRNLREVVAYRPSDFSLAYLAYDLHLAGVTDGSLADYVDWQLFGLGREQVLDRLDALDRRAGLIVQRAGSLVRISWGHSSMEEVIRAYTAG